NRYILLIQFIVCLVSINLIGQVKYYPIDTIPVTQNLSEHDTLIIEIDRGYFDVSEKIFFPKMQITYNPSDTSINIIRFLSARFVVSPKEDLDDKTKRKTKKYLESDNSTWNKVKFRDIKSDMYDLKYKYDYIDTTKVYVTSFTQYKQIVLQFEMKFRPIDDNHIVIYENSSRIEPMIIRFAYGEKSLSIHN